MDNRKTYYVLTATNQTVLDEVMRNGYQIVAGLLDACIDGEYRGKCEWYHHEEQLCEVSAKHRGVLFTLEGDGIWRKYFMSGMMQYVKAIVTFPAFDTDKLQKLTDI